MLSELKSESVPVDENKYQDESDNEDDSNKNWANNCSNPVLESESRKGSIFTNRLCETDHCHLSFVI